MSLPTYDELLNRHGVDGSLMELPLENDHRNELASKLESCRSDLLAACLQIPNSETEHIMSNRGAITKIIMILDVWKSRHGPRATFGTLVKALINVKAIDSADKVVAFTSTLASTEKKAQVTAHQTQPSSSVAMSLSQETYSGPSPVPSRSPSSAQAESLHQLEEDFLMLVNDIEAILKKNDVQVNTITKRFRMLPPSIRRQQVTDQDFKSVRRKILDSRTIEELFDNLTELKHWSFMMPDTLARILKDVKITQIHEKLDAYMSKLSAFKSTTKLKDVIKMSFAVPDYCIELTMQVKGWEDKTIKEVEEAAGEVDTSHPLVEMELLHQKLLHPLPKSTRTEAEPNSAQLIEPGPPLIKKPDDQ